MNGATPAARPGPISTGASVAQARTVTTAASTPTTVVSPARDGALIALFGAVLLALELLLAERIGLPGVSAKQELIFAHVSEFLLVFIIALSGVMLVRNGRIGGGRFLLAMSLVPLTRLLTLAPFSTAVVDSNPYIVLGALSLCTLIPLFLMMRSQDLSWGAIGYRAARFRGAQGVLLAMLAFAVAVGAGFAQYFLLKDDLDDGPLRGGEVLLAMAALLLVTFQQESLYRGLLQTHGGRTFGAFGTVVWPALLFTAMHVSTISLSVERTLMFLGVTLVAAVVVGAQVRQSATLWVALLAQFAANVALYVVAPHVL